MRLIEKLAAILVLASLGSPSYGAEMRSFFGIDAIDMESTLDYDNGTETYDYTGLRLRYGIESSDGGSAGLEFMPAMEDEQVDPFGTLFELVTGPAVGAYFTVGKPVYVRLGISIFDIEYTPVGSGITDKDTLTAIDLGIGFNISTGPDLTFYGEFQRRDAGDVNLPTFFFGEIDQVSDIISLGVNYKF